MTYQDLLGELSALAGEKYRAFQKRLLADDSIRILGVRVPELRKLAKKYRSEWDTLSFFPDEIYEVTFLKCLVLGLQPYPVFTQNLQKILPHIDNWAVCDCFDAPCIKKNRDDFLHYLERFRFSPHTFTSRYALVQLLRYYCEEAYLPFIFESIEGCDHTKYYVSMAAAWLMAEVLVKHYEIGVETLKRHTMSAVTHNRAIRKACESYRISEEQKRYLRTLKRRKETDLLVDQAFFPNKTFRLQFSYIIVAPPF